MDQGLISELLKYSILLPILLAVGWFALMQHRSLRAVEKERVKDIKDINDKLIVLSDKWAGILNEISQTVDTHQHQLGGLQQTTANVHTAVENVKDELKELRADLKAMMR